MRQDGTMTLLAAVGFLGLIPPDRDPAEQIRLGFVTVDGWLVQDPDHVLLEPAMIRYTEIRVGMLRITLEDA
jgi:hypothetical protein